MRSFKYEINGNLYEVEVGDIVDDEAVVTVNGVTYDVLIKRDKPQKVQIERPEVVLGSGQQPERAKPQTGPGTIKSPLPAVVQSIPVKKGDAVKTGQCVAVVEAMKMENEIYAPHAGTVTEVHVTPGQNVLEGDVLVTIEG